MQFLSEYLRCLKRYYFCFEAKIAVACGLKNVFAIIYTGKYFKVGSMTSWSNWFGMVV